MKSNCSRYRIKYIYRRRTLVLLLIFVCIYCDAMGASLGINCKLGLGSQVGLKGLKLVSGTGAEIFEKSLLKDLPPSEASIKNYESSCNVKKMLAAAATKINTYGDAYRCYRAVKSAANHGKLISDSSSFQSGSAVNGLEEFKANGFKNLMDYPSLALKYGDPRNPPHGAILVYGPSDEVANLRGPSRNLYSHGDIQIAAKNDYANGIKAGYYNDRFWAAPYSEQTYGSRYGKPIAVLVLPMENPSPCR